VQLEAGVISKLEELPMTREFLPNISDKKKVMYNFY
jgi:hypothetical protein